MIHIRRLYRLSRSDDMGFAYEEGGVNDHELFSRANGKRKFAEAYLEGKIKAKLTDFYEIRGKKQFGPINVIVMSTPNFIDNITSDLIMEAVHQPYYITDDNVVAWMAGYHKDDINMPPIFIIREDVIDGKQCLSQFFEGIISDLQEGLVYGESQSGNT